MSDKHPEKAPPERSEPAPAAYLNHGVPSLVAKDSPDDFEVLPPKHQKRGSRR